MNPPTLAVPTAHPSPWRRFRSLDVAMQVGAWIGVTLVLLVIIGAIGNAFEDPEAKLTPTVVETTANTPTPAASSATEAPTPVTSSPPAALARVPTTAVTTTIAAPATSGATATPGTTTTSSLPLPTTAPSKDLITGYGATRESWDQHHEKAPGYTDGAAYKPLLENGQPQYAAVCCDDDEYIITYMLFMPKGSTMETTIDRVRREFPTDATSGPLVDQGECTTQEWRSTAIEEQALEGGYVPSVAYFPPDPTYPPDEQRWSAIFTITTPGETTNC